MLLQNIAIKLKFTVAMPLKMENLWLTILMINYLSPFYQAQNVKATKCWFLWFYFLMCMCHPYSSPGYIGMHLLDRTRY